MHREVSIINEQHFFIELSTKVRAYNPTPPVHQEINSH